MSPSFATIFCAILPLFSIANAHMKMTDPAPIRLPENTFAVTKDYDYTSPLSDSGSDYPCKGYASLLDTAEGGSVATYAAGSSQSVSISGGANHNGGSCQLSISEDGGSTFKVIQSYIGNCPVSGTSSLSYTLPAETKSGKVLLAWSWFNRTGNREMYMNCAAVTVTGGGSGLSAYPDIFTANIGNGCTTVEGTDVEFPNPGSAITTGSGANPGAPVGSCGSSGSGSGSNSGSGSGSGSGSESSVVATPTAATSTAAAATSVAASSTVRLPSSYPGAPAKTKTASVPEASPSDTTGEEGVIGNTECKRSVRYTRALPVQVPSGCQCSCENNKPVPVCGASY